MCIDFRALYEQNADFKRYVDRYCTKHRISVEEAIKHALVRDAGEYYKKLAETTKTEQETYYVRRLLI